MRTRSHRLLAGPLVSIAYVLLAGGFMRADEPSAVRVDTGRLRLTGTASEATLQIPLTCPASAGPLRLQAEIVDEHAGVRWAGTRALDATGCASASLTLKPLRGELIDATDRLSWRVSDADGRTLTAGSRPAMLVSPQAFELEVIGVSSPRHPGPVPVRFTARRPLSDEPMPDVAIALAARGATGKPLATATTSADGTATASIELPRQGASIEVEISAAFGPFGRKIDDWDIYVPGLRLALATDKPLYQPGETVHIRALAFGHAGAEDGQELAVEARDADGEILLQRTVTTDEFGIAQLDWKPSGCTGEVQVTVLLREDEHGTTYERRSIQVRAYELPVFSIRVRPERPFMLPGEDADVSVEVKRLDGRPVVGALVEVREAAQPGERDRPAERPVLCRATTSAAAARLRWRVEENLGTSMYRDRRFRVAVTEPTTGRREVRSFQLRQTVSPLHAYFIRGEAPEGLRRRALISTYRADGEPVPCRVCIEPAEGEVGGAACTRTGRYGLGWIDVPGSGEFDEVVLALDDGAGHTGRVNAWFSGAETAARIRAVHALLSAGEPARFEIESADPSREYAVMLLADGVEIDTRRITTEHGRALVEFPYRPSMRGVVSAFASASTGALPERWGPMAEAGVYYPDPSAVRAHARFAASESRPGATVGGTVTVRDAAGNPVDAAVGIVVLDSAIEERLAYDGEEDAAAWLADAHRGIVEERTFAGRTLADLAASAPGRPDSDLDTLVGFLAGDSGWQPAAVRTSVLDEITRALGRASGPGLQDVERELDLWYKERGYQARAAEIEARIAAGGASPRNLPIDPWGQPCQVRASCRLTSCDLGMYSAGPDGAPATNDDLLVTTGFWSQDFVQYRRAVAAVTAFFERTGRWPASDAQVREALSGPEWSSFANLDGRSYQLVSRPSDFGLALELWTSGDETPTMRSGLDTYKIEFQQKIGDAVRAFGRREHRLPRDRAEFDAALRDAGILPSAFVNPAGRPYDVDFVSSRLSAGSVLSISVKDGVEHQRIDLVELAETDPVAVTQPSATEGTRETGISVTVVDEEFKPIAGAPVKVLAGKTEVASGRSADDGTVTLRGLAAGTYDLVFECPGYEREVRSGVVVRPGILSDVTVALYQAPFTAEGVTVTSALPPTNTGRVGKTEPPPPMATTRVRTQFPETLLWLPEVRTDHDGTAAFDVPLADTLTRWHLQAVASTRDGRVAFGDASVVSRLPFSVDVDLPRFLTVGDALDVIAVVHNDEDRPRTVAVTPAAKGAVAIHADPRPRPISANGIASERIRLSAGHPGPGRVLVTAQAGLAGDAVEREIAVHPLGRRASRTESTILSSTRELDFAIPKAADRSAVDAGLVAYASLAAQIERVLDGLQQQPIGCAEQVSSAAYLSLWQLRYRDALPHQPQAREDTSKTRVTEAMERLRLRMERGGGVAYFAGGDAQPVLTSYVARFLWDASLVVPNHARTHVRAVRAVLTGQDVDGSWSAPGRYASATAGRRITETAFIARNLASVIPLMTPGSNLRAGAERSVRRALAYVAPRMDAAEDPYVFACVALAAGAMNDAVAERHATDRLVALAQSGEGRVHWDAPGESAFWSWGDAGTIETTALAALALFHRGEADPARKQLVEGARVYLLQHRGEYDGWWSTQASALAVEALLATSPVAARETPAGIAIRIDGGARTELAFGPDGIAERSLADLAPGMHHILVESGGTGEMVVTTRATWYEPWAGTDSVVAGARAPHATVSFDGTTGKVGDPITCRASLAPQRQRGMHILEIGLPPGADVDDGDLEAARLRTRAIESWEVQPDRLVLYTWSWQQEPIEISFRVRPRFAGTFRSAPSAAWPYYNPAARIDLPPVEFHVTREDRER